MTTIHVTASRDYDVLVQPGLLDDAGAQIARVLGTGRTAAIVAGETVAGLYAGRLAASLTRAGFRAVTFTYPGGEHCKTLATYAALLDFLAVHRLSRSDLIVALGGGVTGDLAGFAAATVKDANDVEVRLAQSHPDDDIQEPHFVIEIFPIFLPWTVEGTAADR